MRFSFVGLSLLIACGLIAVRADDAIREPTTLTYDNLVNGPWATAESWVERLAPIAGDSLSITGQVLLTEADVPIAASAEVIEVKASSTLTISNETTAALNAFVRGAGSVVKLGAGLLDFTRSASKSDDFKITGGLVISNGIVRYAATTVQPFNFGRLAVWAPGELHVPDGPALNLNITDVHGDGIIANPNGQNDVQLRFMEIGVWDGMLAGKHLRVYMPGDVTFTCPTSTINYSEFCAFGGCISFTSFGMLKSPSTTGYANMIRGRDNGGTIRYIGEVDETTDKIFTFSCGNPNQICMFDGGAHGGVTFTGKFTAEMDGKWSRLYLTGSNSVPMVIAGECTDVSTGSSYFIKTGSGTWYFKDTTSMRSQRGVYELREGILRFDSIANYGETCSLGPQNHLVASTNAINNTTISADYAFLLGTQSGKEPVLEYTGLGKGITDRLIAVAGTARLRNTSTRVPLWWQGGVVPYGNDQMTRRVLFLEGCEGVTNRIDNLRDRDGQSFDLVIDGGIWELGANNTFSGKITVQRGKLLAVPHKPVYTWFKWRIRETGAGRTQREGGTTNEGNAGAREIAFFDENGNNVVLNALTARSDYNVQLLQPGEMCYDGNVASTYCAERALGNLVNGEMDKEWLIYPRNKNPRSDDSTTWFSVVFRMPESTGTVVGYDVWTYGDSNARSVCSWDMLASEDGVVWTKVSEQDCDLAQKNWFSGSTTGAGATARDLNSDKFFAITYPEEDMTGYGLPNVANVEVNPAAVYEGRADTAIDFIDHLKITSGMELGSYKWQRIPENGVFDVSVACDWFRVTMMESRAGLLSRTQGIAPSDINIQMHELAFYDAQGKRVNCGLTLAAAGEAEKLKPGEVCYTTKDVNDYSTHTASALFDDLYSGNGFCATRSTVARADDPKSGWISFVLRLENENLHVSSYDWVANSDNYSRNLMAWRIEASVDGSAWATVSEETYSGVEASKWYFDGSPFVSGAERTGYPLDYTALANKVLLRDFTCTADFSGCTEVANFRKWVVTVNGIPRPTARFQYANGKFSIILPGTILWIK